MPWSIDDKLKKMPWMGGCRRPKAKVEVPRDRKAERKNKKARRKRKK